MDERLRRVEREGSALERLRARRRAGWSEAEVWAGLATSALPYAEALALARELDEFRFVEVEGVTGRFEHVATGLEFRLVPGGSFLMGSPEGAGSADERPQHEVAVAPFLLCATACTERAWDLGSVSGGLRRRQRKDLPIEAVSWRQARAWSKAGGLRLPTEAEWEFACRAEATTDFCCGDRPLDLWEFGWFREISGLKTHPVGQLKPNGWGLYDMHGNVMEWCEDTYSGSYAGAPCDGSARNTTGAYHVTRGGGSRSPASCCRSAYRNGKLPDFQGSGHGFRPARSLAKLA